MKYHFLVTVESQLLDTYSIQYKDWCTSPAPMISHIAIPTRAHKDEALLLLSLGLDKEQIEAHFNKENTDV